MKKKFLLLFLITVGIVIASCKSHEKCPAYSKVNQTNSEKIA